jgi:hypothetical protein
LQAAAFQNQRDVIEALIEGGAVVEVRRHDLLWAPSRRCLSLLHFCTSLEHATALIA